MGLKSATASALGSILVSLALSLAASVPLTGQVATPERSVVVRQLDSLARNFVAKAPAASVAIGVMRGRDTLAMFAQGYADVSARRVATANTIYRVGSLTKQFTAALILRLAERHQLALDDTIGQYVSGIPAAWRPITIRRLLNHTGGLPNYTDVPGWRPKWKDDFTPQQLLGTVRDLPLDFAPGTGWAYSNTGYVVLGMIIEKVTGLSYEDAVRREIFAPLGMAQSLYCPSKPTPQSGVASGYTAQDKKLVRAPYLSMTQPYAAGALCSSVGDFLRWQDALVSGRVVAPSSYLSMTTPAPLGDGSPARDGYGFGLGIRDYEGHRRISHDGGVHGFLSFAAYFPRDSLRVVIFSNTDTPAFDRLVESVQQAALGLRLDSSSKR
jgi:D-alanyl-D-alanine carboxypeptidase